MKQRIVCGIPKHGPNVDREESVLLRPPNPDCAVTKIGKSARYIDSLAHCKTVCRGDRAWVQAPAGEIDTVSLAAASCATGCSSTPIANGAVSRKTHGGAGTFDIDLPLTGTVGVECRLGGGTNSNDHTVVVTFGANVSVNGTPQAQIMSGSATIGSNGTSNGGAVTVSGATVTVPLASVANGQRVEITLNNVNNGSGSGNVVIPMGVLRGDTNGNGFVNATDIAQTKASSGQTVTTANFRTDVSASGSITATDIAIVKSSSGAVLPAAGK